MEKSLRAVKVRDDKKNYITMPEEGDVGYLIITGLFTNKTVNGKLDELSFLPVHKVLSGIIIPISAMNEAKCAVEIYDNILK